MASALRPPSEPASPQKHRRRFLEEDCGDANAGSPSVEGDDQQPRFVGSRCAGHIGVALASAHTNTPDPSPQFRLPDRQLRLRQQPRFSGRSLAVLLAPGGWIAKPCRPADVLAPADPIAALIQNLIVTVALSSEKYCGVSRACKTIKKITLFSDSRRTGCCQEESGSAELACVKPHHHRHGEQAIEVCPTVSSSPRWSPPTAQYPRLGDYALSAHTGPENLTASICL